MYPYFQICGRTIGSYGLMMAVAVLLVAILALRKARKQTVMAEDILIVGATGIAMGLVCGKLLYILVTYPIAQIWSQLLAGDFHILSGGGIVFYGGLIGGILGAFLGIRIAGCSFADVEHTVVPYIPLGHAVGRIGCFLAGCCYGCRYDGFLAVYYPNSVAGVSPAQGFFPIQLTEAVWNVAVCIILLRLEKKLRRPLDLLSAYLAMYAVGRFVLEWFRGDADRGIFLGFSLSQWISMGLLLFCAVRLFVLRLHKEKIKE